MSAHKFNAAGVCVLCFAEEGNIWKCAGAPRAPVAPKPHDLTQSEVTFAKILAAYQANAWAAIGAALYGAGLIGNGKDEFGVSPIGEALLDRARKAGVL